MAMALWCPHPAHLSIYHLDPLRVVVMVHLLVWIHRGHRHLKISMLVLHHVAIGVRRTEHALRQDREVRDCKEEFNM
jgi:hypothetical protein